MLQGVRVLLCAMLMVGLRWRFRSYPRFGNRNDFAEKLGIPGARQRLTADSSQYWFTFVDAA